MPIDWICFWLSRGAPVTTELQTHLSHSPTTQPGGQWQVPGATAQETSQNGAWRLHYPISPVNIDWKYNSEIPNSAGNHSILLPAPKPQRQLCASVRR